MSGCPFVNKNRDLLLRNYHDQEKNVYDRLQRSKNKGVSLHCSMCFSLFAKMCAFIEFFIEDLNKDAIFIILQT